MTNDDNYGPWIDWAGGECPIPDAKYGDYWLKYSDNSTFKPRINAAECTWNPRLRGDGFSIIAYRVRLPADDLLRQAVEALRKADTYVPWESVRCRGDKCRLPWCESCCGEEQAQAAIVEVNADYKVIRAVLAAAAERGL